VLEVHRRLERLLAEGRPVALATLVETSGSTPRAPGARMLVAAGGETWFSVGGGPFEARVIEMCLSALESQKSALETFDFRPEEEGGFGAVCGGRATVFIEPFHPPDRLLIVGAGHCGCALAHMAVLAGFAVEVVDDRKALLLPERFPEGVALTRVEGDYSGLPAVDERSFVAIISRDHRGDLAALRQVVGLRLPYLGMIGSKRKRREIMDTLEGESVPAEHLERVHCPIGLDIGAETPEEIAIAVLAEMIAVRRRGSSVP
jgi:xanthine dehydrogenase accessory factor